MLQLYVNKSLLSSDISLSPLLFPFWKEKFPEAHMTNTEFWRQYGFDASFYTLSEGIEEADFVCIPHNYWDLKKQHPDLLRSFIDDARKIRKPILIDAYGDSAMDIPVENACILRDSLYRFRMKPNEVIVPAPVVDLKAACPDMYHLARSKSQHPRVGFVGWAGMPLKRHLKVWLKSGYYRAVALYNKHYTNLPHGVLFRRKAAGILMNSTGVDDHFIIRNYYYQDLPNIKKEQQKFRLEYIKNIVESDYVLNVKGNGNYSFRFYETLSLGRIPLFIDTSCVLPLESIIDYEAFCIFVKPGDINQIDNILIEFHRNQTVESIRSKQEKARDAFDKYLRIDRFTKYMVNSLKAFLNDIRA